MSGRARKESCLQASHYVRLKHTLLLRRTALVYNSDSESEFIKRPLVVSILRTSSMVEVDSEAWDLSYMQAHFKMDARGTEMRPLVRRQYPFSDRLYGSAVKHQVITALRSTVGWLIACC